HPPETALPRWQRPGCKGRRLGSTLRQGWRGSRRQRRASPAGLTVWSVDAVVGVPAGALATELAGGASRSSLRAVEVLVGADERGHDVLVVDAALHRVHPVAHVGPGGGAAVQEGAVVADDLRGQLLGGVGE